MKKTLLAITILTTLIFHVFADDSASTTLTASAEPVTVTTTAADRKPAVPLCAIGIDALFIGRVFPGISYTKVIDTNASYSIFAGAISDSKESKVSDLTNSFYVFFFVYNSVILFTSCLVFLLSVISLITLAIERPMLP